MAAACNIIVILMIVLVVMAITVASRGAIVRSAAQKMTTMTKCVALVVRRCRATDTS